MIENNIILYQDDNGIKRVSLRFEGCEPEELFKEWLAEEAAAFRRWDFSRLDGRMTEESLPWDYRDVIGQYLHPGNKLLDMGTGGGEFLLSLNHPHQNTFVTEAYTPNVELCLERLSTLGITIKEIADNDIIPYDDDVFDIVLNRHESFDAQEVFRVLKPDGIFITQETMGTDPFVSPRKDNGDGPFCLASAYKGHKGQWGRTLLSRLGISVASSPGPTFQDSFADTCHSRDLPNGNFLMPHFSG